MIFKKIKQIFLNKLRNYKDKYKFYRIHRRTLILKNKESSDFDRWKKDEELLENWNERTYIISKMIPEKSKVIEFGAGKMMLKEYLTSNCIYQGSDLVQRNPDMKPCDLNAGIEFSLMPYNTAVFSGVLEYVYDIDKLFSQLHEEIYRVVLSYATLDHFPMNREKMGWLSGYRKEDLESIFEKYGYQVKNYQEWKRQSIYKLEKKGIDE